ncbi:MAG: insulinase family protein, partial [Candidatus Andersenbacteria bacterium]|nr:insulinase family protein [Candidatus Andersenbacteria bacterium]
AFYAAIYPHHPYGHPILGTIESVLTLTIDDLKQFYHHYYTTKNAMIVIEGLPPKSTQDIEQALQELKTLVEKYTGATTRAEILHKERMTTELI